MYWKQDIWDAYFSIENDKAEEKYRFVTKKYAP